jgi:hypothetical protein
MISVAATLLGGVSALAADVTDYNDMPWGP